MSLYAYKVLDLVIQQGSFQNAAELLYLTPSAVSHIIAKLEKEIGLQLLNRSRTGVSMTSACETLLPHIRELISVDEGLTQHIAHIRGSASGIIKLGTFNSITVRWLPGILSSFRAKYPEIEIRIMQGGYKSIENWVASNTVDLAFLTTEFVTASKLKGIETTPIYKDRIVCIAAKGFFPKKKKSITASELEELPLVMQNGDYDQESRNFLERHGLSFASPYLIDEDNAVAALISAGFGVNIMTRLIAESVTNDVDVIPVDPPEYREICLVTSRPKNIAPAVALLKEHIKDCIAVL